MEHQGTDDKYDQLLQKETIILGNILPTDMWEMICERLPMSGLRDMSNASPYFRSLLLPKRTQFLLPDVLKHLSKHFEKEELQGQEEIQAAVGENEGTQGNPAAGNKLEKVKKVSNILKMREVCKSWNKSVDQFIEDTSQPSFFNVEIPSPNRLALEKAKYNYFGDYSWLAKEFLAHFEQSHMPLMRPPRNPFIGRLVVIHITDVPTLYRDDMMDTGKKLLQHYGQHVRILNIGLRMFDNQRHNYLWLNECLSFVPNLTHLKVCSFPIATVDMQFGEHINRQNFGRPLPANSIQNRPINWEQVAYIRQMGREARAQHEFPIRNPANAGQVAHANIEASPLPNLKCLKMCNISAFTYNHLIQSYRHVEWLHMELGTYATFFRGNFLDWREVEFPNLKTLFIQLNSPAEARRLDIFYRRPLFNLTRVHLEYSWKAEFFEWGNILEIIEENWEESLVELKLRLPKPSTFLEHGLVRRDAVLCTLNLPKLKKLKIWIHKDCEYVRLMFLDKILQLPGLEFKRYDDDKDH